MNDDIAAQVRANMPSGDGAAYAALIAEARGAQKYAFDHGDTGNALIFRALTDALEAVSARPLVADREAMADPNFILALAGSFNGDEGGMLTRCSL